jgi:hypothetical protein
MPNVDSSALLLGRQRPSSDIFLRSDDNGADGGQSRGRSFLDELGEDLTEPLEKSLRSLCVHPRAAKRSKANTLLRGGA